MKLIKFRYRDLEYSGTLKGTEVISRDRKGSSLGLDLEEVSLLAPVRPSKVICVGLNYADHAKELNMPAPEEPIIFIKPPSAVIGPGKSIFYPLCSAQVDYEAELAVVIKDEVRCVAAASAKDHILGYTCFNDVTARDLQKIDGQWTRAKSFDTFAPLGPWIESDLDVRDIRVSSYLNGEIKQSSRTSELIFDIPRLIEFISGVMTLFPGDVIATGTPAGVGPMAPGDEIVVEIEGIGRLVNLVERAV
jgi:2-keto-4-pentenoate hydratase/2-oxohepta-3-ene-1,7-dioic acid hydratase in catechol pathway